MRGRATRVALPALVVLALVAVVAVAATGSVPSGSNSSRAPSETLLDTLFTLWIVAVAAGGILLVYGLVQRQAIAEQMASGRYRRVSVLAWVALRRLPRDRCLGVESTETAWPERRSTRKSLFGRPGQIPPTPDEKALTPYEPSVSWLLDRRRRRPRRRRGHRVRRLRTAQPRPARSAETARGGPRASRSTTRSTTSARSPTRVARSSPRMRVSSESWRPNGVARHASETSDEYLARVLRDLELRPDAIGRLTELFTQAKFSHHDVDSTMKESAISALEQVRDELRAAHERSRAPEPRTAQAVTS